MIKSQNILKFIDNLGKQELVEQASLSSMRLPKRSKGSAKMKGFRVFVKIKKGWVLFDPYKGIYFSNKMGEWATIEEINNQNWKLEKLSPTEIPESFFKPYLDKLPSIDNIGLTRANTQSPVNRLLLAIQQIGF